MHEATKKKPLVMDGSESVEEMIKGNPVMMFSKTYCPHADLAKKLFKEGNVEFGVVELDLLPNGKEL